MSLGVEWGAKYTLVGPDGTIAVFNDSTDANFVGILTPESSGLDSPDVREDAMDSVDSDGGIHGNFYYGRRPVVLVGTIIASSVTDRNAKVSKLLRASNAMRGDAVLSWKPQGAPAEVFLNLRRQQPARVTEGYVKKFQLAMVSAAADIKSKTEKTLTNFSEEEKTPSTVVSETGVGTVAWTNPANAKLSDNVRATAVIPKAGESNWLKATGYGFSLPATAIPVNIKASIEAQRSAGTGTLAVRRQRLVKANVIDNGVGGGFDFGGVILGNGVDTTSVYNMLENGYTKADVENANFGLAANFYEQNVAEATAAVDSLRLTVLSRITLEAENAGDSLANWTATLYPITGTGLTSPANVEVINETTGEKLVINYVLSSGDAIEIDSKNRTIVSAVSGNIYNKLERSKSTWFGLKPGANKIKTAGGNQAIIVNYRDTWL